MKPQRTQSVRITDDSRPPETRIHLSNDYIATGMTTACGIVDPTQWKVEHVDDLPDCEQCIAVAEFFRNLRCANGSIPRAPK